MQLAKVFGFGLILLTGSAFAQAPKDPVLKEDTAKLAGSYTITSGEEGGKKVDGDKLKDTTVRITADTMVVSDHEDKEMYVTKYTLDMKTKPYKITMIESGGPRGRKGAKAMGLIEKDGDDVKLIYCYEGGIVPTEFKTTAGEKQLMFMMKKKEDKK